MSEQIDINHFPEVVDAGKGIRRLELMGLDEQLTEVSTRRAFFCDLADDDFRKMTGYINSVTRGEKISYVYQDGRLPMLATPSLKDKSELMSKTFQTIRDITRHSELDDHAALRRAGLTMAGALNYIHPYKDGNGRTGRVTHYLIEFGTERGETAFGEELYAVISKLPVYDSDKHKAMYDSPPPELERALNKEVSSYLGHDEIAAMNDRDLASARVVAFLDMMKGVKHIPINEKVKRKRGSFLEGDNTVEVIQPGDIDGVSLYEKDYVELSALPRRSSTDLPPGAHRVIGVKPLGPSETIELLSDILN